MSDTSGAQITSWLSMAKEEVQGAPTGTLSLASRIRLWQILDVEFPSEWHFRCCSLAFLVGMETVPRWYDLMPYAQITDIEKEYPRTLFAIARRTLLGQLTRNEALEVFQRIIMNDEGIPGELPGGIEL